MFGPIEMKLENDKLNSEIHVTYLCRRPIESLSEKKEKRPIEYQLYKNLIVSFWLHKLIKGRNIGIPKIFDNIFFFIQFFTIK